MLDNLRIHQELIVILLLPLVLLAALAAGGSAPTPRRTCWQGG
jgi:hypothetical protein